MNQTDRHKIDTNYAACLNVVKCCEKSKAGSDRGKGQGREAVVFNKDPTGMMTFEQRC